ncbi:hypothetical protein D9758_015704 [Tetrapyrgos nigripes]|uniref:Uncharacterized protein n=1 Tax=Tetrapyrgos nigripes TaxID=182062 RepID=A0A8H5C9P2_9AGAR|nr:hypothetical protein D9758_015704 [Tetrapyrgos nigripes]
MPPYRQESDAESEDDLPEALSLSASKQSAQKQSQRLRKAVEEKERASRKVKKERNREMDKQLKERAQKRKKFEAVDEDQEDDVTERPVNDVETRMLRAMQQAEEESGLGSDEEDDDEGEGRMAVIDDSEEASGDEEEEEEEGMEDNEDEDMDDVEDSDEEDLGEALSFKSRPKSNHLPDHLFASAFSQKASKEPKKQTKQVKQVKKRKKARKGPKDTVVGSRAIRTLSNPNTVLPRASSTTVPSAKVKKFLNRNLRLKGDGQKSRTRGWERRAVNLGSMRGQLQGPAAHFVRSS